MKIYLFTLYILIYNLYAGDLLNFSSLNNLANNISVDKKETLGDPNMKLTLNNKNNISESLNNRVNDIIENIKIGVGGEVQFLTDYRTYTSGIGAQYSLDKYNKIITSVSYKYYEFDSRFAKNGFEKETRLEYNINNRYSIYTRYSFNELDENTKSGQLAAGFNFMISLKGTP